MLCVCVSEAVFVCVFAFTYLCMISLVYHICSVRKTIQPHCHRPIVHKYCAKTLFLYYFSVCLDIKCRHCLTIAHFFGSTKICHTKCRVWNTQPLLIAWCCAPCPSFFAGNKQKSENRKVGRPYNNIMSHVTDHFPLHKFDLQTKAHTHTFTQRGWLDMQRNLSLWKCMHVQSVRYI